ncbi:MAG TPA: hypothetical protein VGH99_17845 [Pseudonocardia sp.]
MDQPQEDISVTRSKTARRGRKAARQAEDTPLGQAVGTAVETLGRVGAELRSHVAELDIPSKVADADIPGKVKDARGRVADLDIPGKVAELDIPGKVADLDIPSKVYEARKELAGRIDPGPKPRRRRRVLWVGLFLTAAAGAAFAWLSRTPEDEDLPTTAVPPVAPPSENEPGGAPATTPPSEPVATNGSAPTSSRSKS